MTFEIRPSTPVVHDVTSSGLTVVPMGRQIVRSDGTGLIPVKDIERHDPSLVDRLRKGLVFATSRFSQEERVGKADAASVLGSADFSRFVMITSGLEAMQRDTAKLMRLAYSTLGAGTLTAAGIVATGGGAATGLAIVVVSGLAAMGVVNHRNLHTHRQHVALQSGLAKPSAVVVPALRLTSSIT